MGQYRQDRLTPYIKHIEAVVESFPKDAYELRIVAWLHDVIEDTDITEGYLLGVGIPPNFVISVVAMTKNKGESYDEYLIRVKGDFLARKVKIMDILHNLGDDPSPTQVQKYAKALKFLLS